MLLLPAGSFLYSQYANAFAVGTPLQGKSAMERSNKGKNAMGHSNFSSRRAPVAMASSVAIAAAFAFFPGETVAGPVSAVSSIANGTYIDSATSGNFDISGAWAGKAAVSGTVTATFQDNSDPWIYLGQTDSYDYPSGSITRATGRQILGLYQCGTSECWGLHPEYYTDYYYQRDITYHYWDPIERARLTVGSSNGEAASSSFDQGFNVEYIDSSRWYPYEYGYHFFTTTWYSRYYGQTGSFSVTLSLDTAALADLNADGILGFGLSSVSGDFLVTGITLNANLVAAPVPEPETYAMMLAGLGLLGFVARRRKQQAAA